ncbi:hypothetical protein LTR66_006622 [Elasticomyces elasticus]|nr:hypothetical protein LTR66_006622 [Elasticomyces elasticus]
MDPILAIGLASAIVTFVDIGAKITKRLKELSEAGDLPEVFRDIKTRLPLIISIVVSTQLGTGNLLPEALEAFKEVVRRCFEQVHQLDDILKKVTIAKGDSRMKRTVKVEKLQAKRRPSEPLPSHAGATGMFLMPFSRDDHFVGRENALQSISADFGKQKRVAISGIGGVGKSQIAIEYCYRYKERKPDAHVFWVHGGNVARFYQGYKRIAQLLELPGWDDPEASILELVSSWSSNTHATFLLVVDNADNIENWWPGKYKSVGSLDDPSKNLSKYLPENSNNGHVLITTRDNRVAGRLAKQSKPIAIQPMSNEEARSLFLSKLGAGALDFDESEVHNLLEELDRLPLAVSQAAAFIEENGISIVEYTSALRGEDAEEFLHEELDDARRDEESVNSVFRTWKLSYDQIKQQKSCAADLLCLLAMLDRQSVPKSMLKVPEVTTSLAVLQSFNLITARAGSQSFQIHRLVQKFVQVSVQRDKASQKWKEMALACISRDYPTEIGVAEWPICDALAPHVQVVTGYEYKTTDARLDLAHLLCWAADFDIERGMYVQALERAEQSLMIFQELVLEDDERLAAATWLYGRLCYYEAQSAANVDAAAKLLEKALSISKYPSLNFAESAFELAHLYYDQCNESLCFKMGKASFECWKAMEGPSSVRTLDNMHDYALELAMLGHKEEGIAMWQEILELCPASDASENTKTVYTYRSMAGIAEFQGDAAIAEIFYAKLITLCEAMYNSEHIHLLDYRLSHAEQIMRQGRLNEATQLSKAILASCTNKSEWGISASCLQTIAECCRLRAAYEEEEIYRLRTLELHERNLGHNHKKTVDAKEALADCYLNSSKYSEAKDLYQKAVLWRKTGLGQTHTDTIRAIECLGICHAHQGRDAETEAAFLDALGRQSDADARLLDNLCTSLWNQGKWKMLESRTRQIHELDGAKPPSAYWSPITALEQQGKMQEALEMRAASLELEAPSNDLPEARRLPTSPPVREDSRFGRMVHPRTWSA